MTEPINENKPINTTPKELTDVFKEIMQDVLEDTMEDVMGTSLAMEESNFDEMMDLFGTVVMIRAIARLCNVPYLREQEMAAKRKQKREEAKNEKRKNTPKV